MGNRYEYYFQIMFSKIGMRLWNKQSSILLEKLLQPNRLLEKIHKETLLVRKNNFDHFLT